MMMMIRYKKLKKQFKRLECGDLSLRIKESGKKVVVSLDLLFH